jgi:hypothetical protein
VLGGKLWHRLVSKACSHQLGVLKAAVGLLDLDLAAVLRNSSASRMAQPDSMPHD